MAEAWAGQEGQWDFFGAGFRHELSPRHLFGQDGVDFQERVNFARLREYRLGRLRGAMAKHRFAALLLNLGDSIRYATGIWDYAWKSEGQRVGTWDYYMRQKPQWTVLA